MFILQTDPNISSTISELHKLINGQWKSRFRVRADEYYGELNRLDQLLPMQLEYYLTVLLDFDNLSLTEDNFTAPASVAPEFMWVIHIIIIPTNSIKFSFRSVSIFLYGFIFVLGIVGNSMFCFIVCTSAGKSERLDVTFPILSTLPPFFSTLCFILITITFRLEREDK